MKKIMLIMLFLVGVVIASDYDKDIVVKNQSRNDKVEQVFKEMMQAYEEEDLQRFFSFVSEDRFVQDYMTFYDAIDSDMRAYDILSVDTWVDKITDDGVKRYLYVKWDKRYESSSSTSQINQTGYSRFLFDEINGEYKLIELAGNNFWGKSLAEWREEVPTIAGQEDESTQSVAVSGGLPDLIIENLTYDEGSTNDINFDISNIGLGEAYDATWGINYTVSVGGHGGTYAGAIAAGSSVHITITAAGGVGGATLAIDPDYFIDELNDNNNEATIPTTGP